MQTEIINYDAENDILYVSIGKPVPSVSEEKEEGIIIRRSIKENKISGVTILDYKLRKQKKEKINVPKEINLSSINI